MKKKLLFVVNVDWFFVSHRIDIARAALREGYEVHIATSITVHKEFLSEQGFFVHNIPLHRSKINPFYAVNYFFKLINIFRKIKPNIVHFVTIKPVLIGGLALKFVKVSAAVFAISGMGYVFIGNRIRHKILQKISSYIYNFVLRHKNSIVICQNTDDLHLIRTMGNFPLSKFILIKGSGVDLQKFKPSNLPPNEPIIMFPSRILKDKGVMEFIEAAKKISLVESTKIPPKFVLVGMLDKGNKASLDLSEISELEKSNIVEYWGNKENMEEVLPLATIIVLPSYREGLPKVLIEASACSRPVITSDVPGCRDAIINKKTGLLVPAKDSHQLADAILMLLNNPELCKSFGEAGRIFAEENFSIEHVVSEHLGIYSNLVD
tara:strand:- start:72 stop:1205 length:1134 start_codon:yes stop_codon:yes gene_type:complete